MSAEMRLDIGGKDYRKRGAIQGISGRSRFSIGTGLLTVASSLIKRELGSLSPRAQARRRCRASTVRIGAERCRRWEDRSRCHFQSVMAPCTTRQGQYAPGRARSIRVLVPRELLPPRSTDLRARIPRLRPRDRTTDRCLPIRDRCRPSTTRSDELSARGTGVVINL